MSERVNSLMWSLVLSVFAYTQLSTWNEARETNRFIREIRDHIATTSEGVK